MSELDELYAENFVMHAAGGVDVDLEGMKQRLGVLRTALPDANSTIEDMVAEGDKVACRLRLQGTHQGKFLNIAPTGKQITVTYFNICRLEEGKIAELWMLNDYYGIVRQMGAVPPMAELGK